MDSLFDSLPEKTQLLIDEAFDQSITSAHNSGQKARNNHGSPTTSVSNNGADGGGGFILDEDVEMASGGFVNEKEDETTRHSPVEQIPIRLIPSALQLLDLPPDDEEILSVFKNAASGWTSSSISAFAGAEANEKYVSRDDWRSVCAVLLDTRDNVDGTTDEDPAMKSDEYTEEVFDEFDSDEECTETKKASVRRGKRPQRDRGAPSTTNEATKRQRETCLDAYALFFPDVPSTELHKQMIKVSDLQRAFKLLGERIKADEMVEMLEMFSSNTNKTMDFDDFTRMMMTAKLA